MKGGHYSRLKWVRPKPPKKLSLGLAQLASTPVGRALRDAVLSVGLPRAGKPTNSPRAQTIDLLKAAAEVEHALLTQYLFAAYSIDSAGPAANLKDVIVEIAVEEMGHLITVQNLLRALGAEPYFDRESIWFSGRPAGQYPFPLRFEPLSGDSLAKYVETESMPLDCIADKELYAKLKPIFERAEKATGTKVNHVGLLYAKIFWNFQKDDSPHPYWPELPIGIPPIGWHVVDKDLKGLGDERQVTAAEFGRTPVTPSDPGADQVYVIKIDARDDALFAIAQIARQGEGYQAGQDSHFNRFVKAYDDFANSFPTGIRAVPVNPNTLTKKQTKPEIEASRITHPKTLLWAKLFDVRYQVLLLELWLGTATKPSVSGALGRAGLFDAALHAEMIRRIQRLANQMLPEMDLKTDAESTSKAAAPFELPDEALPQTEKSVKARLKRLLANAEALADEIEKLHAPNAPSAAEKSVLDRMRTDDKPLRDALA